MQFAFFALRAEGDVFAGHDGQPLFGRFRFNEERFIWSGGGHQGISATTDLGETTAVRERLLSHSR